VDACLDLGVDLGDDEAWGWVAQVALCKVGDLDAEEDGPEEDDAA